MAASPQFKVYDRYGTYQAACKEPEAAATVVSFYGDGSTIRFGHSWVLWAEGSEAIPAFESYDTVAATVLIRLREKQRAAYKYPTLPAARTDGATTGPEPLEGGDASTSA